MRVSRSWRNGAALGALSVDISATMPTWHRMWEMLLKSLIFPILPIPLMSVYLQDTPNGAQLDGASDVVVSGNYAYVTSQFSAALEVVDVSHPESPIHVGVLQDSQKTWQIRSITIEGKLCLCYGKKCPRFFILLIFLTPPIPGLCWKCTKRFRRAKLNDPRSVVIYGGKAYVASFRSDVVEVIDLTQKNTPVHSSYLNKIKMITNQVSHITLYEKWSALCHFFLSPGSLEIIE